MFDVLNQCIVTLGTAIGKKVHKWVEKIWMDINYLYV